MHMIKIKLFSVCSFILLCLLLGHSLAQNTFEGCNEYEYSFLKVTPTKLKYQTTPMETELKPKTHIITLSKQKEVTFFVNCSQDYIAVSFDNGQLDIYQVKTGEKILSEIVFASPMPRSSPHLVRDSILIFEVDFWLSSVGYLAIDLNTKSLLWTDVAKYTAIQLVDTNNDVIHFLSENMMQLDYRSIVLYSKDPKTGVRGYSCEYPLQGMPGSTQFSVTKIPYGFVVYGKSSAQNSTILLVVNTDNCARVPNWIIEFIRGLLESFL